MAKLDANFQFDIDRLNFNKYVTDFRALNLDQGGNDPWEDMFTFFTQANDALRLFGSDFDYNGKSGLVREGTVEAISEFFQTSSPFGYSEIYLLSDIEVASEEIYQVAQTESGDDDFALLQDLLSGNDLINMSAFDDKVRGFNGSDLIFGFGGSDVLRGDNGQDTLRGGSGDDKLIGGDGRDSLHGGAGDDTVRGGSGDDFLRGSTGDDKIIGGGGEDLFKFKTGDDKDTIKDFNTSFLNHDRIDLSRLDSVTSWSDLKQNHMEQDGQDVVIDGGNGDVLILQDTSLGNLVKMFFDF